MHWLRVAGGNCKKHNFKSKNKKFTAVSWGKHFEGRKYIILKWSCYAAQITYDCELKSFSSVKWSHCGSWNLIICEALCSDVDSPERSINNVHPGSLGGSQQKLSSGALLKGHQPAGLIKIAAFANLQWPGSCVQSSNKTILMGEGKPVIRHPFISFWYPLIKSAPSHWHALES